MTRGVIWLVWGNNDRVEHVLPRSVGSMTRHHPELPQRVFRMPDDSDLRCKAHMHDLSPFDETLYLDADTVVLGRLDFGFEKARQHGIACCINISPWARRYKGLRDRGELIEYDTGAVWFTKSHPATAGVFDAWKAAHDIDSSSVFLSKDGVRRMLTNDQCGFAHAVDVTGFNPWILPMNFNLHPTWQKTIFGDVKVWHCYGNPPPSMDAWNAEQASPDAVNKCGTIER